MMDAHVYFKTTHNEHIDAETKIATILLTIFSTLFFCMNIFVFGFKFLPRLPIK